MDLPEEESSTEVELTSKLDPNHPGTFMIHDSSEFAIDFLFHQFSAEARGLKLFYRVKLIPIRTLLALFHSTDTMSFSTYILS